MQISGNTILLTGGTSGIGRALAEAFHRRGNQVIITGRRQRLLDEITADNPGMAGFRVDIQDDAMLAALVSEVGARFPGLNVLIANAGISSPENMAADGWDAGIAEAIVDTNIMGVIRTAAAFLPVLKKQANATFMATSSALAFVPRTDFPTYCASKAFLHSWLVSMRHQLRQIPVEVLELSPPYVQTELTGPGQASDPRAMPLSAYIAEVMTLIEQQQHPEGEILLEGDKRRRWAEKEGNFDAIFRAMNP
ncbi:SDR family oxidoreductase [Enterobacter sp. R1(2018)]|uniref:SDR family oxidoreductase n=1 Tax=Enterobacter sp. R1(2018) TaxID=2447891 RepID=UPI000EAE385E|nr:SDR family NAD(P)-dependent oxidoreductase [Enterobacter sp. R1(2018)]RKQ38987.1 SDR family NAD(P)-dependent oxidoreductase [Enterobacter sp. R1(2018)]